MSGKTKAQLEQLLAETNRKLEVANEELSILRAAGGDVEKAIATYKERVKKRAFEAKAEYDWCEVIDGILEDLGIDPAMPRFRFTAMIPVTFEAVQRSLLDGDYSDTTPIAKHVNARAIERVLQDNGGQGYSTDDDAILSAVWDTYSGGYDSTNDWSVVVGDNIEVQDVKLVESE